MFRIFFAVLAALFVFRCASAQEAQWPPGSKAAVLQWCQARNAHLPEGTVARWCDCLITEGERRIPADDIALWVASQGRMATMTMLEQGPVIDKVCHEKLAADASAI